MKFKFPQMLQRRQDAVPRRESGDAGSAGYQGEGGGTRGGSAGGGTAAGGSPGRRTPHDASAPDGTTGDGTPRSGSAADRSPEHGAPGTASAGREGPSRAEPQAPEAAGISRTSQAVALTRATMDRPHSPEGDPDAQARLCRGMRPTSVSRLRPMLTARTRFFDGQVLAAIAGGSPQVVICGAGYDDRALRFRTNGVRFFELDQGPTQADKARRLRQMGAGLDALSMVRADFRRDDVAAVLAAAGHDAGQPSLFICEGLLVYLDQPTTGHLLAGLASRAAPGSVLAASLAVHGDGLDSARVASAANARRRAGRTEPWRTILPAQAHTGLLRRAGWQPERTADAADLEPIAAPGRTLLVTARPA